MRRERRLPACPASRLGEDAGKRLGENQVIDSADRRSRFAWTAGRLAACAPSRQFIVVFNFQRPSASGNLKMTTKLKTKTSAKDIEPAGKPES